MGRLLQASTIKGIIQLGGSLGLWTLSDSMQTAIVATVMGILGLINVIVDEHKAAKKAAASVASSVASGVARNVASNVAEDTAKTAVEQNLHWLANKEINLIKE